MSILSNSKVKRLLNCFDVETQNYLLDFCDRISNIQADVFIVMARKATCFFNCLEELGLIHFNGYVTSERALDMSTEWLEDQRVVIIDDAIVSGTSIYKTIERLKSANVRSIEVHVLTVNEKWFQPSLLKDNEKNYLYQNCNKQPDQKCIDLCYSLVNAILLQPRPYDIDFPLYCPIKVKPQVFNYIVSNMGWSCYDVSSSVQKENEMFSLSIIPNAETINKISRRFGFNFNSECLIKIRLYGTHVLKKKELYEIRIVPMVVLNKMSEEQIDQLFGELLRLNSFQKLENYFVSHKSKLRLLQFYFAVKLSEFWLDDLNYVWEIDKKTATSFSERNLSFLFPVDLIQDVETICRSNYKMNFYSNDIHPNIETMKADLEAINPVSIKTVLTKPFLDMYYNKELPCRTLVKQMGKEVFLSDQYKELRQRLDQGITFAELKYKIENCSKICDINVLVSLFIDQAVDVGIAVPTLEEKDGFISRAYRHGEDVLFGKREEILYGEMLYQFQQTVNRPEGLTHLSVEKMIVLFTRIGLKKNILKPYISNFTINPKDDNEEFCNVLRVKTALMGPIGIVGDVNKFKKNRFIPYITDEAKSMWLTNVFAELGYLNKRENDLYDVIKPDTSSVLESYIIETQNFSYLMGDLFNENIDTGINFSDDDIVKICSCLTLPLTIQAVSAELYLFFSNWKHQCITKRNEKTDKNILKAFRNNMFSECINNAYMKIKAYDNKEAIDIIKKVNFGRKTDQNIWKSYFDIEQDVDINNNLDATVKKDLIELYNNQKAAVYLINIFTDLIYISMLNNYNLLYNKKQISAINKRINKIRKCLTFLQMLNKELKTTYYLNIKKVEYIITKITDSIKELKMISDNDILVIMNLIDGISRPANMLLERTNCLIGQHGKVNSFKIYSHCACITFEYNNSSDLDRKIHCIKKCLRETRETNEGDKSDIMLLPEDCNPDIHNTDNIKQVWIIAKGENGYKTLTRMCLNILYAIQNNVKVLFFHDIGHSNAVKISERTCSEYFCNNFYSFIETFNYSLFLEVKYLPEFVYIISEERYEKHDFKKYMDSIRARKYYGLISENINKNSLGFNFTNITYQLKETCLKEKEVMHMDKKQIGIITVLPEETQAVINQLNLVELDTAFGSRTFYVGELDGKQTCHKVILTQQLSQGQESVIPAYYDLIHKFSPDIIFLVGIAGGIHNDADYCDVVIGDEVVGYDKQKDTPDGIKRRGTSHRLSAKLKPIIQSLQQSLFSNPLSSADNSKHEIIRVYNENIASGSAVIANELSKITEWIHQYNDKIFAVEMEAYGFSTAFYESELSDSSSICGAVIIRGISDLADTKKKKTENYRYPAACNAAIVLKELVKHIPKFNE